MAGKREYNYYGDRISGYTKAGSGYKGYDYYGTNNSFNDPSPNQNKFGSHE